MTLETCRAFIGLPVNSDSADVIESWASIIELPHGAELIMSPRSNWHVTLHFFGSSIDRRQLLQVWQSMRSRIGSISAVPIQASSLVGLPMYQSHAWVLALEPTSNLLAIQEVVTKQVSIGGLPIETHPYFPHITIWRPKHRAKVDLPLIGVYLPEFTLNQVALYESHQQDSGSRYEILDTINLKV